MAAAGEITPMPEAAIFADTQAEPQSVYRWLDWLETQLPFPVHRVTAGDLGEMATTPHVSAKGRVYPKIAIPSYTKSLNGKIGRVMHSTCTRDYKIKPITKAVRKLAGVNRGEASHVACVWLGISIDEIERMKPMREAGIKTRHPLVEKRVSRSGCRQWLLARAYPDPPRSACFFCPFHDNTEWRAMKAESPEDFAAAVSFDARHREMRAGGSQLYLHRSCKPLDQIDFRNDVDRGQLLLWQDECSGMCGV